MVEAAAPAEGMALDPWLLGTEVPWPPALEKRSRVTDGPSPRNRWSSGTRFSEGVPGVDAPAT